MLIFAIKGTAHGCKGFGERKDVVADQQVIILCADRMPKHAFGGNRYFRNQIRPSQRNALCGGASQDNPPDYAVLLADVIGI